MASSQAVFRQPMLVERERLPHLTVVVDGPVPCALLLVTTAAIALRELRIGGQPIMHGHPPIRGQPAHCLYGFGAPLGDRRDNWPIDQSTSREAGSICCHPRPRLIKTDDRPRRAAAAEQHPLLNRATHDTIWGRKQGA